MKYIFRGNVIFDYDETTHEMRAVHNEGICNFNFCNYISEDYKLFAQFFETAYKHTQLGDAVDTTDIEVY